MIRHFFLDKSATIIKGSKVNTGLNPVLSINYGNTVSRGIIHFDTFQIAKWIKENSLDESKLSFRLHMTNYFNVDSLPYEKTLLHTPISTAERACSFDLEFYKLWDDFDMGRGYEYKSDLWIENRHSYSEDGANWYNCSGMTKWSFPGAVGEYDDIDNSGKTDSLICKQHFDFGNENIDIDITDYILTAIGCKRNHGICIKFPDEFEKTVTDIQQYVGFFTDNTNLFFHPYVEAIYDNYILDNRENFCKGKTNRLYLYTNDDGNPIDLDTIPTCFIDDMEYPVQQQEKGVYYVELTARESNDFQEKTIMYDVWSNIILNEVAYDDIEQEFVVHPAFKLLHFGSEKELVEHFVPSIFGVNDNEDLDRGEIRQVVVDFRKKYSTNKKALEKNAEYRLYIKDANREITILDYQPLEQSFLNNYFILYTEDLIPNKYYIDIRIKNGKEERYHKDVLHFRIKNNVTERYNYDGPLS